MSWHTVTTRFEVVRYRAVKNLPCPRCGNGMGEPKTRSEIYESLKTEARTWQARGEHHGLCEPEVAP